MATNNELLRTISQALQHNQAIHKEILKLLQRTTIPDLAFNELKRLLAVNKSTIDAVASQTPTDD